MTPIKKVKGNIIDTWERVYLSKYHMILPTFPHPAWDKKDEPNTFIPEQETLEFWLDEVKAGRYKNRKSVFAYENIIECRYYEMEGWLTENNEGYFLIQNARHLGYNIFFELEDDAVLFKLTWCLE